MRIAIPIWGERISPVFDTASNLLIVEIEDQREISRFVICLDERQLPRRCYRIKALEVDILICGAISRPFSSMLTASGIKVISWISGRIEEVLQVYLTGTPFHPGLLMPGCKRNRFMRRNRARKRRSKGKGDDSEKRI